jgi:WD40 repeat protein
MRILVLILFALLNGHIGILSQKPILTINSEHTGMVFDLAYSKDGKYIISGGEDNLVKLWEVRSQKCIRTFPGQGSEILSLCFSGDGKKIASGGIQKINIWSTETGALIKSLNGHTARVSSLSFTPDDKQLVSGSHDGKIILWDIETGNKLKEIKRTDGQYIHDIVLTQDGKKLLCASGYSRNKGEISLWDLETGKLISRMDTLGKEVMSVSFTPDGKKILSGDCMGKIKLWDLQTGNCLKTIDAKFGALLETVSLSPDGKYFAACDWWGLNLKIFNIETGICTQTLKAGNGSSIRAIKFSPDGLIIAANEGNKIIMRNAKSNVVTGILGNNIVTTGELHFIENGKYLFSGNKKWNTQSGQLIMNYAQKIRHNGFSKDGTLFLTIHNDNKISIWDQASGKNIRTIQSPNNYVYAAVFSGNGKNIICAEYNGAAIINMWDIATGKKLKTIFGPNESMYIGYLDISEDGKRLLMVANTKGEMFSQITSVKILEPETGRIMDLNLKVNKGVNGSVSFSKDGAKILTYIDGNLFTYDAQTGQPLTSYADKNAAKATCATFSPDTKMVAAGMDYLYGGTHQFYINLYASDTEKPVKSLKGHTAAITSIVFTHNGKQLVTTALDQSIKYWNIETGEELLEMYALSSNDFVAITPEGLFDGTAKGIKYLYYVKGLEVIPLESMFEEYFTPKLLSRIANGEIISGQATKIEALKPVPEIKILFPETLNRGIQVKPAPMSTDLQTAKIKMEVTDKGGGIDEVILFQNGKLVQTTKREFKKSELMNETREIEFEIALVKGLNQIKVIAFNNQRTECVPVEFSLNAGEPGIKKPTLHLLAIGINEYKNARYNLNYAVSDAEGIKKALELSRNSLFGSINSVFISNEEATKKRIQDEIRKVVEKASQDDIFIFYFGGHGMVTEDGNPMFYLIPHDITQMYNSAMLLEMAISGAELKEFSAAIKAQKQLFILDACQSGGIGNMVVTRGAIEEKAIAQLARSTGTYWLAASNSNQFAGEFSQLGHGVFTFSILQGLAGKADGQNDKIITVQELSAYISDQVPQLSKVHKGSEQYPVTYGFGNDFPIYILK